MPTHIRTSLRFAPLLPALLLASLPARAQETVSDTTVAGALATVQPGELLRVDVRGGTAREGVFAGVEDGALVLGSGATAARIPAGSVRGVWQPQRHTKRGAWIGGAVGGLAGLGVGALAAIIISSEGDGEGIGTVMAGTTLLGAGAGAGVGAITGAAVTRWKQLYPVDGRTRPRLPHVVSVAEGAPAGTGTTALPAPGERSGGFRFGTLEGGVSYGRLGSGSTGGIGGRVGLLGVYRPVRGAALSLGPEVEIQSTGKGPERQIIVPRLDCSGTPCVNDGEDTTIVRERYQALAARMVLRVERDGARARPYLLAGGGLHAWRVRVPTPSSYTSSYVHPGYTFGGGVRLRSSPASPLFGVDVRRSGVVRSGDDVQSGYWTVSGTISTRY
jgi:hypothetical protein